MFPVIQGVSHGTIAVSSAACGGAGCAKLPLRGLTPPILARGRVACEGHHRGVGPPLRGAAARSDFPGFCSYESGGHHAPSIGCF